MSDGLARAGGLSTAEAARRLGVRPQTVYAYVSRGLLHSTRRPGGRESWFDAGEVERLVARTGGRTGGRGGGPEIRTALTLIQEGRLYYRGVDATTLARTTTFEAVAEWLWRGEWTTGDPTRFVAPPEVLRRSRRALATLPPTARLTDRLPTVVAVAAAADPLRFHTGLREVATTAATLLAAMIDALPLRGEPPPAADQRLAARLWPRLTDRSPEPAGIAALNAALVLLADHDLAASTMAARVAASTRAHPYAVVAAGLAALDGPLHGSAATAAHKLIAEAIANGDPMTVYADRLRADGRVAGFVDHVHHLYPRGDVRAEALLAALAATGVPAPVRTAVDGLVAAAGARSPRPPTIDFALAVLCHATGMVPDAGEVVFAIARAAGWVAHALEEYAEPGQRFRFTGTYVGEPAASS